MANDLKYAYLGNGLTVFSATKGEANNDNVVAHINERREVKFYSDRLSALEKLSIIHTALFTNLNFGNYVSGKEAIGSESLTPEFLQVGKQLQELIEGLEEPDALELPIVTQDMLRTMCVDYATSWGAKIDNLDFDDWYEDNKESY